MKTQVNKTRLQLVGPEHTLTGDSFLRGYRLDELLSEAGLIDEATREEARLLQRREGISLVEAVVRLGVISEGELVEFLSRRLNQPAIDLENATLDLTIRLVLPELPCRYLAVPWLLEDSILHVAMADPTEIDAVAEIIREAGFRFRVHCSLLFSIKQVFCPSWRVPDPSGKLVLRKVKRGERDLEFEMGDLHYQKADASGSYEEALKWWLAAAASGHAEAAYRIAKMYDYGTGVAERKETALPWYRRAAERGSVDAQLRLGWILSEEAPSFRDYQEAAKWYRMAAEQGNAVAQNNLAVMYGLGEGVNVDHVEAVRWYLAAAEQGNAGAQCNLAFVYEDGRGVIRDRKEASKWFRAPAEAGNIKAQNFLGDLLQSGRGANPGLRERLCCGFGRPLSKATHMPNTSSGRRLRMPVGPGLTEHWP